MKPQRPPPRRPPPRGRCRRRRPPPARRVHPGRLESRPGGRPPEATRSRCKKTETTGQACSRASLTEQDRKALQENLEAVQGQLRTQGGSSRQGEAAIGRAVPGEARGDREEGQIWEALFRESTIERSLQDAAVKHEAWQPAQIVTHLRPRTRADGGHGRQTGKPTGKYKPMVEMLDVMRRPTSK